MARPIQAKVPLIVSFEPYEWGSHKQILPALIHSLEDMPARVFRTRNSPGEAAHDFAHRFSETCNRIILLPPLVKALDFLRILRTQHNCQIAATILETSHIACGGFPYVSFRGTLTTADSFVGVSEPETKLLREFFINHDQIYKIPYAVPKTLELASIEKSELRRSYGIPLEAPVFLYLGRLTPQKNITELLKAHMLLLAKLPGARLLLAGDFQDEVDPIRGMNFQSDYASEVMSLAHHFPKGAVQFLGRLGHNDAMNLLNVCDVQVSLTSFYREEFGFSLGEGMSLGKPTVATVWGGGVDFANSSAALPVPVLAGSSGMTPDIQKASDQMCRAYLERNTWRKRAAQFWSTNLSMESVTSEWRKLNQRAPVSISQGAAQLRINPAYLGSFVSSLSKRANRKLLNDPAAFNLANPLYQGAKDPDFLRVAKYYRGFPE